MGINSKVHNNSILHNMTVVSNLNRTLMHNVHNTNNVLNNTKVNMLVNGNFSQSLINRVHNKNKVRHNTKDQNIKVDSKLSQPLIKIVPNINILNKKHKVVNTCFDSFSTCSINRSSNFYFTADRALSLPNVTANHGDSKLKKISHCNIIQDKTIINTINISTNLTCSCSSLLQQTITFFDRKLLLKVHLHVITVPPKIWIPNLSIDLSHCHPIRM